VSAALAVARDAPVDERLDPLAAMLRWRRSEFVFCEHCWNVAEVSRFDPDRCAVCAPSPDEAARLAAEVRSRVRNAVRAAAGWPRWSR
jgi:hypothetical protein